MKLLLKGLIICFLISFITNINVNASEKEERLESQLEEIGIEEPYSENIADYVYYYVLDDEKIESVVQRGEKIASTVENKSSVTDFKFSELISIYNDFSFITKTLNLKLNFSLKDKSIEIKEKDNNTVLIKANLEQISDYYNNYINDFAQDGIMTMVKEEKRQKREMACIATVEDSTVNSSEKIKSYEDNESLKSENLKRENKEVNLSSNNKVQNNNLSKEDDIHIEDASTQVSNLSNDNNLTQSKNSSKEDKDNNVSNVVNTNEGESNATYYNNISESEKINIDNNINENEKSNIDNISEDKKVMANILNSEESNEVNNNLVYTRDNIDTLLWIAVIIIALIGVLVSAKRLIRG